MPLQEFLVTTSTGGGDLAALLVAELRQCLQVEKVERFGQARYFFFAEAAPDCFEALCAPEKVYAVVLRRPAKELQLPQDVTEAELAVSGLVTTSPGWASALETWGSFTRGDRTAQPRSFRVSGRRAGKLASHLGSNSIAEAVGEALGIARGWDVDLTGFDVQVVVHLNDEFLLVLLPLLERSSARQNNFACAGLTQPVAWAMARTLDVAPGEVVVDPMCGAGIILLEAVQCWQEALYFGFDESAQQLQRAAENLQLLSGACRQHVALARADATCLPLAAGSVDAIVCDLPFGKLFGSEATNEVLYPAAVAEFRRVLKPVKGRAVLLTSLANSDRLGRALCSAPDQWAVTCRRRLLLGHMESMLFVAFARPVTDATRAAATAGCHAEASETGAEPGLLPPESSRLPWEDHHGRHRWSAQKAKVRQSLQPVGGGRKALR